MKNLRRILVTFIIILVYIYYFIASICMASYDLQVYSEAAVLMEQTTGKVLYKKNAHKKMYPASTTKILTCIIALEECDLNETAVASEEAVSRLKEGYTKANIVPGEEFTIEQLLLLTMLQSANEAANVIAEHISGSIEEFAELMNKRAKEMGALNSHFVNPNGMHDENHYTTAYDLAKIARYCMTNEKYKEIVLKDKCDIPDTEIWNNYKIEQKREDEPYREFYNTNKLIKNNNQYYYPYCTGGKAGFTTPAKNCFVATSNKDGFELVSVVLHAELTEDGKSARYVDLINMFEYGYNNYTFDDVKNNFEEDIEEVSSNNIEDEIISDSKEIDYKSVVMIISGAVVLLMGFIILYVKRNRNK